MYISRQLKEENIAEYLLYMWQVEDLLRANGCDIERIDHAVIAQYGLPDGQKRQLRQWYEDLIAMMHDERVEKQGHLQINKNIILLLTDLHVALLRSPKFPSYSAAYYKALPYIVDLRRRSGGKEEGELETCFEALYGIMLLRLQKKPVSAETGKAMEAISSFLSMLANYYEKDREGKLELEN